MFLCSSHFDNFERMLLLSYSSCFSPAGGAVPGTRRWCGQYFHPRPDRAEG